MHPIIKIALPALVLILMASNPAHAQSYQCIPGVPGTVSFGGKLLIPGNDHPEIFEVLLLARQGDAILARSIAEWGGAFCFSGLDPIRFHEVDLVVRLDGFKELREPVEIPPRFPSVFWMKPVDQLVSVDERLRGYPKEAIDEFVLAMNDDFDKDFKNVVKHLEKVVTLAADWYDAHCELGAAYEEIQRYGDAEKQYRAAIELKPGGGRALMNLGRLLILETDEKIQLSVSRDVLKPMLDQAHEALATVAMSDPMSAMANYLLGAVDFRLGSYKEAENELRHALELDATLWPARLTLINVYEEQKEWEAALDNLDQFLVENPTSPYLAQAAAARAVVVRRLQAAR